METTARPVILVTGATGYMKAMAVCNSCNIFNLAASCPAVQHRSGFESFKYLGCETL